jgi:SAM-dependent methyltransferase
MSSCNPILGGIDLPEPRQQVSTFLLLQGWAFTPSGEPLRLEVSVDGKPLDNGVCGFPRYDIYRKYRSEPAYCSGFLARLTVQDFANGSHRLEIVAQTAGGTRRVIGARDFIKQGADHARAARRGAQGKGGLGRAGRRLAAKLVGLRRPSRKEGSVVRVTDRARPDVVQSIGPLGGVGGAMRKRDLGGKYVEIFRTFELLEPDHDVLDVGCGVGRMAVPLTRVLAGGSYRGLDNAAAAIDYCQQHITARFPDFQFSYADVYNKMYNPNGRVRASEYRFPFADESFDFVFAVSVFTHMLPADFDNYLKETARVLRQPGRCLVTLYLLNSDVQQRIDSGRTRLTFRHKLADCSVEHQSIPEGAVAYGEQFVESLLGKHKLRIVEPIRFGDWSGLQGGLDQQDIVIAES